jgi:CubicO group peptidase (beta-lactamase class C family)
MGGVAGSAGVFTTVHDVGLFAQALLDRLAGRPSTFPLTQASVEAMTTPQQPGHHAGQVEAANGASETASNATDPLLAADYPAIPGQDLRGFGWDIDTPHSRPRGALFPVGSFGHTGFTGVTLWIDPGSDTYVVVLANVIHQRGGPPIATLSGHVATETARALHLYGS